MEGLQRSATSFRRQGSSGLVWEDRFISGELNKKGEPANQEGGDDNKKQKQEEGVEFRELRSSKSVGSIGGRRLMQRSRSNKEDRTRSSTTGKVSSPVLDPPSPKLSGCGFCAGFGGGGGKKPFGAAGGGGANQRSNKKGKRKT
ncbi:hypothetical protein C5167_012546 [Papaver somniferum]|uniref:MAPK kinase substrate protein n=1 Tax=Papaver somniferum TaxID=3469 RepID=A0A4Y7J0X4_PAPSO|nr:uncharacterized protein At1g15400-like [Papaver somniferum]RZC53700.1 hypothetical protein C5167_012546 [Papaver somniferum]